MKEIMFIGNYGMGLALKRADKNISLGLLFLAVQFVDIIFGLNILQGTEKWNVVPGTTTLDVVECVYFPLTHSLIASLVWTGVVYVLFRVIPTGSSSQRSRVALVMGSGVYVLTASAERRIRGDADATVLSIICRDSFLA